MRRRNKVIKGTIKVLTASALALSLAAGTVSAYAAEGYEWISVDDRQFKIEYLLNNQEYLEGLSEALNANGTRVAVLPVDTDVNVEEDEEYEYSSGLTTEQYLQIERWAALGVHDQAVALRLDTNDNFKLVQSADEILTGDFSGDVILNVPNVRLADAVIHGDLIVTEAIGNGRAYLDSVEVHGTLFVRAGGTESIHITGSSLIRNVVIDKADDNATVALQIGEGATIEAIVASHGGLNVVGLDGYEPTITRLEVGDGATITVDASVSVGTLEIVGNNVTVIVSGNIENLIVTGESAAVTVSEGATVESLVVDGADVVIAVSEGAVIETLQVTGTGAAVDNQGTIQDLEVSSEALADFEWDGADAEVETIIVPTPQETPAPPIPQETPTTPTPQETPNESESQGVLPYED